MRPMSDLLEREELLATLAGALQEGGRLVFVGGEARVSARPRSYGRSGRRSTVACCAAPAAKLVRQRLRHRGAPVPRGRRPSTRANPSELTTRELEVLRLLASGKRNAQIADDLVVSRWTIDHHVSAILRKLGAHTRGEAVATATTRGYLES